jgi:hypothetical protein
MNHAKHLLFASIVAAAMSGDAWAQAAIQYDKIEIKTDKVAPNLSGIPSSTPTMADR